MEKFEDLLEIGDKGKILQFLREKNVQDRNLFSMNLIYWLLKDPDYYENIVNFFFFLLFKFLRSIFLK